MALVSTQKQQALANRLVDLGIKKTEVIEKFVRSGGRGGQNVNKVATTVYLKHLPTGLEVKMSRERSQALNRFLAWRLLADKVEEKQLGLKSRLRQKIEKIRRQKRRRSKRAQEKMLQEKKNTATKKALRKVTRSDY